MQYLKQSTAATLKIGPFIDDTDGKTAETALTIAQADIRLSKNGGNIAQKTEATSCTHDELGIYGCPIDVTDTATLGRLQLWVHESGALPVWHEYTVLPANVYDSLFSTDKLQVDLLQMGGVAQSATDLKDFADAGYDPATSKIEGCKVNDDMKGTDGANTTVPDAAGVGRLDLLIDAILADVTGINGDAMRGTNSAALASVCTEARLVELAAANLPSDIDAILADTGELQTDWANGGRLDLLLDAIPTTAMRGTDSAALASVCTEARLAELAAANLPADMDTLLTRITAAVALASVCTEGRLAELDAANLPADIDSVLADTNELQTDWANGGRLDLLIDAIKAETDNLPSGLQKNVALPDFSFLMTDSTDDEPETGLTVTVQISKDGGAFANATNTPATEISNGTYKIDLTQAEMNAGIIIFKATATAANQTTLVFVTST
jgi:hypothetical protein